MTNDVLQSAYDEVSRAEQHDGEDELLYAQRIPDTSRVCRHEFQPTELVNAYVRGINEAMREKIQEQVRRLAQMERVSMITVPQLTTAEGRSECALLKGVQQSATTRGNRTKATPATKSNVMTVHKVQTQSMVVKKSPPSTPAVRLAEYLAVDEPEVDQPKPPKNPMKTLKMTQKLEEIFILTSKDVKKALEGLDKQERGVDQQTVEVPDLRTSRLAMHCRPFRNNTGSWNVGVSAKRVIQSSSAQSSPSCNTSSLSSLTTCIRWLKALSSTNDTNRNGEH